jgi:predicted butyrate kinase (DUF1464 family)
MARVIGIDPGTVTIDLIGLDDGEVFLDRSIDTLTALATPSLIIDLLENAHRAAPLDLVAGPSGYGLPLVNARDLTERDLRLSQLTAEGEQSGGIGGLGTLLRLLAKSSVPVILTPGVVHLATVPTHRKVNRVDMGTADKVCAAALAIHERADECRVPERDVSMILLELGGAFTAALAVEHGAIVDGAGGTSGALGLRAAGALDGEVAFLAGSVSKHLLFGGGAAAIAGLSDPADMAQIVTPSTTGARVAREAYFESAAKAVAALRVAAPRTREVVLSGRVARVAGVVEEISDRLAGVVPGITCHLLAGFATVAKHAAQGAALIADGLAGGASAPLVESMRIREAGGTVLDHLYVIPEAAARARLGIR